MTVPDGKADAPPREIRLFDAVCLGINAIVGSGIFLFPGDLARRLGAASPLAFVLAAASAVVIGLCLAELSGRFDRTGGTMIFAREAFGPFAGFAVGWLTFLSLVFGWAGVARGVGGYLGRFAPFTATPLGEALLAISIVVAFVVVNYRGIRLAAWVSDGFTAGKLFPLLLFAFVGLAFLHPARFHASAGGPHPAARDWGWAWFACMFAIGGYENVAITAGETRDARRVVPIAILGSLGGAALLYVAVQTVAWSVYPGLAASKAPIADAAAVILGPIGGALLAAGAAVSMTGFTSVTSIFTPRALVALAESGDFPPWLAELHPRFRSPWRAILVAGSIAVALAAVLGFAKLAEFDLIATLLAYALACAALPVLRRRTDLPSGRFRVPAPFLFAGVAVTISVVLLFAGATWSALGLTAVLFAIGAALRFWVRRRLAPA